MAPVSCLYGLEKPYKIWMLKPFNYFYLPGQELLQVVSGGSKLAYNFHSHVTIMPLTVRHLVVDENKFNLKIPNC